MNDQQNAGKENVEKEPQDKFVPRNWEFFKKDEKTLKKLPPQQRSKYLAYEEPTKDIQESMKTAAKRLAEKKKQAKTRNADGMEDIEDENNQAKLIGQLKAAEARNRIRIMRLRYEANRSQEVNHLIACQPTARKAVRLQALVPAKPENRSGGDKLDKLSRARVEALLDDHKGLITSRT